METREKIVNTLQNLMNKSVGIQSIMSLTMKNNPVERQEAELKR